MPRFLVALMTASVLVAMAGIVPAGAAHDANGSACLIAETLDRPFDRLAIDGLEQAGRRSHVETTAATPDSTTTIPDIIESFVSSEACDLVIGVGFVVAGDMEPAVAANPGQRFAVVDFSYDVSYDNMSELLFRADQAAFLAGYLSAGVSQTAAVGVYGGADIDPVTQFMDGFVFGVRHYNEVNAAAVDALGWDPETRTGLFTNDFQDPAAGRAITLDLYAEGVDTVFAVAGPTGEGSLAAAAERSAAGDTVRVIEPDFDWYDVYGDEARVLLTSVLKNTDVAVFNTVTALADGTWEPGQVWEDLGSGGVGIARFHKTNDQVPGYLRNDLKAITAGIIDGSIPTRPDISGRCGRPIPAIEPIPMVNGDLLFSQTDGRLWTYEPDTGALTEYPLPFGGVWDIQWSGDANTQVLIVNTGAARILELDLDTGEFTEVLCGPPLQEPLGIAVNPGDVAELWIADRAGVIRHDRVSGDTSVEVDPFNRQFDGIAVSPSSDHRVYVTDLGSILYRVAPGEPNILEVVADVAGYGLNGLVFDDGSVFDEPNRLLATSIGPSAIVDIDVSTGDFNVRDFSTAMRSSEDADFTSDGDLYIIDSGLVDGQFGVDSGLYLLPKGGSSIIELIRGAPLGDTVDILVAR